MRMPARGARASTVLLVGLLAGPAGAAQLPEDAPELVAWHAALGPPPADVGARLQRCYVYVRAGAAPEARAAADAVDALAPGHPDAARFRVEVDAWLPATRGRALERARAWLAEHGDADTPEAAHVRRLHDFLAEDRARHRRIEARADAVGWLPWACLAAVAAFMLGVVRRIR